MATNSLSPVAKRHRMIIDFICSECQKQNTEITAEIYCEQCKEFYCTQCAQSHLELHPLHATRGKEDVVLSQTCERHNDGEFTKVCNNHSQLCCSDCLVDHRLCGDVNDISKSVKKLINLRQLQHILDQMRNLQDIQRQKDSYHEQERLMVNELGQDIDNCITLFENNSLTESNRHEQTREDVRLEIYSILTNFETSMERQKDQLINLRVSHTVDIDNCLMYQTELKTILNMKQLNFIDSRKCLDTIQKSEIFLKDYFPDLIFTVKNFVKTILSDNVFFSYKISGIRAFPDGRIIVADRGQFNVKLLDNQYNIIGRCAMSALPRKLCLITNSKVAVTVGADSSNVNEVQFIEIRDWQLEVVGTLDLQHECAGIAYHQGCMYVASGTALYKHTLKGNLVRTLYDDPSGTNTVFGCALSPEGDRIYIINYVQHKLLTLDKNGNVLSDFTDPEFKNPCDVHVTYGGQVLICGREPCRIIQVDREGKNKADYI